MQRIEQVGLTDAALYAALGSHVLGFLEHHAFADAAAALSTAIGQPLTLPMHETMARKRTYVCP